MKWLERSRRRRTPEPLFSNVGLSWLLWRGFKPFLPPDPFNELVIHILAAVVQQPIDHEISIAGKLFGQQGEVLSQPDFVR
tara:strand:- start:4130 stop:4372 length:243 start_codon:yes stop_codon:yes gene_type:complete